MYIYIHIYIYVYIYGKIFPQVRANAPGQDFRAPTGCLIWFSWGGGPGDQLDDVRTGGFWNHISWHQENDLRTPSFWSIVVGKKRHQKLHSHNTLNFSGSIVRLFPLLPCESPLPLSKSPNKINRSRLPCLGNFTSVNFRFNWSRPPVENNSRFKTLFEGFISILKTDCLYCFLFASLTMISLFDWHLKVLMWVSGESVISPFLKKWYYVLTCFDKSALPPDTIHW